MLRKFSIILCLVIIFYLISGCAASGTPVTQTTPVTPAQTGSTTSNSISSTVAEHDVRVYTAPG